MKQALARFALVAAVLVVAVVAHAANAVGKWNGKLEIKLPANMPKMEAAQKKMMDDMLAEARKMRVALELKANNTYVLKATNIPGPNKSATSEGTWKQTGSNIVITAKKEDGKAVSGDKAKPQTMVLSKDGKSMTLNLPGGMGGSAKVIFTR
ncbi:MAG TPA: copper resistance protein NlpE N-terminal domain-containing protein [Fimbriimonadaceae bacterium]|nr:copper resistance protein NlpE N-terminal domain-containing protein [Fimbriimonadaceae bacterium]